MRDVSFPAILFGLAAISTIALAPGCVAVGGDKSTGFQETSAGFTASFPTPARQIYVKDETAVRTLTFTHDGDKVICSRDGGVTFGACDGTGTLVWRAEDYNREHVIKVGKAKAEAHVYRFTPSDKLPGLTFVGCDETVSADENFTTFQTRINSGGDTGTPKVICINDGISVQPAGGQPRLQFGSSHFLIIAREGATAWIANQNSTGGIDESVFDGMGEKDLTFVGLHLGSTHSQGWIISDVSSGLVFDGCELDTTTFAGTPSSDVDGGDDVTIRGSTLDLGGGAVHGVSVSMSHSNFTSGAGVILDGSGGTGTLLTTTFTSSGALALDISGSNKAINLSQVSFTTTSQPVLSVTGTGNTVVVNDSTLVSGSVVSMGILLDAVNTVSFKNSAITVSGGDAIRISAGSDVTLTGTSISGTGGPILAITSSAATVTLVDSKLKNGSGEAIHATCGPTISVQGGVLHGDGAEGVTVEGGTFTAVGATIEADGSNALHSAVPGLMTVTGSTLNATGGTGIFLEGVGHTLIVDSTAINNSGGSGIQSYDASDVTIQGGCNIQSAGGPALSFNAGGTVVVTASTLASTLDNGIYFGSAGSLILAASQVTGGTSQSGIMMASTSTVTVKEGSTVTADTSNGDAVHPGDDSVVTIKASTLTGFNGVNSGGTGPSVTVSESKIDCHNYCVRLPSGGTATVSGSTLHALSPGIGIGLFGGSSATVQTTTIQADSGVGIDEQAGHLNLDHVTINATDAQAVLFASADTVTIVSSTLTSGESEAIDLTVDGGTLVMSNSKVSNSSVNTKYEVIWVDGGSSSVTITNSTIADGTGGGPLELHNGATGILNGNIFARLDSGDSISNYNGLTLSNGTSTVMSTVANTFCNVNASSRSLAGVLGLNGGAVLGGGSTFSVGNQANGGSILACPAL